MSFPQSFIYFLLQLQWDDFFQPSSFCLFTREVHKLVWSHSVTFVLFLVWSEETGKKQRGLNSPQSSARDAARLWSAQFLFSSQPVF